MSEAEIQAQLKATREEITQTLSQLVDQVDPRQAVKRSKEQAQATAADLQEQAKASVADLREQAKATVEEAKGGDTRAIAIVAGVAAGVLAVGALVIRRLVK